MADIAKGRMRSGARWLVVAGGETSGAVVDKFADSRMPRLRISRCGRAGFERGGGQRGEIPLALKSENFGRPEFFSDALTLVR